MTQYSNQFALTAEQGQLTLGVNTNVLSVRLNSSSVATITPGSPLKLISVTDTEIIVDLANAATDPVYGFACYSIIKNTWTAGMRFEMAFANCFMYMKSGAAINAGATLEIVGSGANTVITNAGINTIIGIAMNAATASGQLITVHILTPLVAQNISFLQLKDAPHTYSGSDNYTVKVNGGGTALTFVNVT